MPKSKHDLDTENFLRLAAGLALIGFLMIGCACVNGIRQSNRNSTADRHWRGNPFFAATNAPTK